MKADDNDIQLDDYTIRRLSVAIAGPPHERTLAAFTSSMAPASKDPVAAVEARGLALAGVVITVMFVCCVGGFGATLAVLVWRLIDRAGDLP